MVYSYLFFFSRIFCNCGISSIVRGIVHKLKSGGCNAIYHSKTKHHFKVTTCKHCEVSLLPGKTVKGHNSSCIKDHYLFCNHSSGFDNFSILASNNNGFKVTLIKSLLISRDHPPLNKNRYSLPLEPFNE